MYELISFINGVIFGVGFMLALGVWGVIGLIVLILSGHESSETTLVRDCVAWPIFFVITILVAIHLIKVKD
jgi:hypothetical protein